MDEKRVTTMNKPNNAMKKSIVLLFLFWHIAMFGQETVTTTVKYGVENKELQDVFRFQNIFVEKFEFGSPQIMGKYYRVFIKEFKNGKLTSSKVLFDGTETDLFKINLPTFSFKIFTQTSKNNLRVQLMHRNYGSAKQDFELTESSAEYVPKDFFGANIAVENPLNEEFPLLAIITPTKHEDGSASYCEVVQSEIKAEELGKHFNIPHLST
ncbi:MAG: hypothetical protein D6730_10225 [Bacteroidetes bacterium]|nr:MAG: hypothetical protein D6730_10225 [Bacteroidota bacterium]